MIAMKFLKKRVENKGNPFKVKQNKKQKINLV